MGKVIIQEYTTKNPITMIGAEAGCCWGADTTDQKKNYKRGLECLDNDHGRTIEFPDVYMILDGYSASMEKLLFAAPDLPVAYDKRFAPVAHEVHWYGVADRSH